MYSYFISGFFGTFMPYYFAELEAISNFIRSINKELVAGDVLPRLTKSLFSGTCLVYLIRNIFRNMSSLKFGRSAMILRAGRYKLK